MGRGSEISHRQERNHLLQSILDSSPEVSIYSLDRDYRCLAFNKTFRGAAKRLWDADIFIGMNLLDAIPDEEHRAFSKAGFDQVLSGYSGSLESHEKRIQDGQLIQEVHMNYGSPILDAQGDICGLTIFAFNITERKRMEAELHAKEQQFRTLVENSPDLIMRFNTEGRRIYANPTFERFQKIGGKGSDIAFDDLRGMPIPEHDSLFVRRMIKEVQTSGTGKTFEMDGTFLNGRSYSVSVRITPEFDKEDRVVSALLVAREVSELKKRTDQLLEVSEQRRLAEIRSLEAQVNPHFLYNTLNALNWLAIEHNQKEISQGLRDMADITRYSISQISMSATLADETEWMRKYLGLQHLRFGKSFQYVIRDEAVDPAFRLYKLLFQPLLENAVIHGFDAENEGGLLEISFTLDERRILRTTIRDNGKGFEIDRNSQESNSRGSVGIENLKRRLYSYYGNQAHLGFTSEPGKGTTVEISFPEVTSAEESRKQDNIKKL